MHDKCTLLLYGALLKLHERVFCLFVFQFVLPVFLASMVWAKDLVVYCVNHGSNGMGSTVVVFCCLWFSFFFMLYNVLSCRPLQTLIPLVLCCYMSVDLKLKLKYISFITGHYWQWAGVGIDNKDFLYGAIPSILQAQHDLQYTLSNIQ